MARQSTTPVQFQRTQRTDTAVLMTSGRAAKVVPVAYIPMLRGDSGSGRVGVDIELAEMPRPLLNGVIANFQAWFVPKTAHPQFSGPDEFMHSYQGEKIKALGAADRDPPPFFNHFEDAVDTDVIRDSEIYKTLGLHSAANSYLNTDLIDAFNLIYNFRLAAHSSRLTRRPYATEDLLNSTSLPPAFWPSGRFSRVVPDYERALIVGSLDLDVTAGRVPVSAGNFTQATTGDQGAGTYYMPAQRGSAPVVENAVYMFDGITAEMAGETIGTSLADIDKARTTQAFAKLRTAYAGNDATGFDNDDAIVAELMQGFRVPDDQFKRPWLLDSARVPFGMNERHATDAANLDASVTLGRASATLSLNVPQNDAGGIIIVTVEVLPERLDERMTDEFHHLHQTAQLPDALRDVQRPEPVDLVKNRRLDARHTLPGQLYGYEPMNDVWQRSFTRLGGVFYQADPQNPYSEQRSAIWQTSIVDPEFTKDHWLAPDDFPHDVFADVTAPAFEAVARHTFTITGLTQFGDVLAENNDDYDAIENA